MTHIILPNTYYLLPEPTKELFLLGINIYKTTSWETVKKYFWQRKIKFVPFG
jgi:hypothetical protein